MSFSPFKKPFQERLAQWESQLSLVSEVLDEWLALQRQWMYLEPIFSSEDIQHQLPLEGKRFTTVDRIWRKALGQAKATPHILTVCGSQKLLEVSVPVPVPSIPVPLPSIPVPLPSVPIPLPSIPVPL